jgi:fermentation-respiration switch protein FrsA (DUF1100 family)
MALRWENSDELWQRTIIDTVRTLLLILLPAAAGYVLLGASVYIFQSRLLYFPNVPGRALTATPADIGLTFEEARITTADGIELHGWYVPAGTGAPAVLFCHGNAGNISHRLEWLQIFHDMGLAVLLFDYRGYGRSRGAPDEPGTYRDAQAAWDFLTRSKGVAPARIVIFGESLGGSIAAHLAKDVASAGALILTSTFTSAPDLASQFYWYLPVRLLARFEYPTAEYVSHVRAPTLVIHSRDDEIVPFAHGRKIFERAAGPKEFVEISGDHNAGFLVSGSTLTQGVRNFLQAHRLLLPPA